MDARNAPNNVPISLNGSHPIVCTTSVLYFHVPAGSSLEFFIVVMISLLIVAHIIYRKVVD